MADKLRDGAERTVARYNDAPAARALHTVSTPRRTTLLVILDGFGHRTASEDNAILAAETPNLDRLWQNAPNTLISGSGLDVGLPEGQMGNSEVGHMSLGAGRIAVSYTHLTLPTICSV